MGDIYLQDVIDQSIRQIRGVMAEGEISSTITIPDNLPPIRSDERILRQVFLNLLSNAIKFTPKGGAITLSATVAENQITIILTDTGIGMSQDELEISLQPFGQVESHLIKKHQGTGLGLPLVKSFVELLNGIFNIKSKLGFGTEITLIFPIGHDAA
jgi:two-component system cell cycle sensor histidine kinase PleC